MALLNKCRKFAVFKESPLLQTARSQDSLGIPHALVLSLPLLGIYVFVTLFRLVEVSAHDTIYIRHLSSSLKSVKVSVEGRSMHVVRRGSGPKVSHIQKPDL